MIRLFTLKFLALLAVCQSIFSTAIAQTTKPKIVILGVDHSAQLVNSQQQPAAIRAFIQMVHPKAVCIERSPLEFARNDFYEFTYEQQYCVLPYCRKNSIPVYPVDWLPEQEDELLAFGIGDLETPPFTRKSSGFLGFTVFDSVSVHQDLFFAEAESYKAQNHSWYDTYAKSSNFDFPRRLFLYRTFMQAKRVEKAAQNLHGDTLLVIIGAMHKDEIEKILTADNYTVIKSSLYGKPPEKLLRENYTVADAFAITDFNLMGMQSLLKANDTSFISDAVNNLTGDTKEILSLKTRYDLFKGQCNSQQAINRYKKILVDLPQTEEFSWTGVKNRQRIDSYFDPFGNLTIWQRIHLEIAREYFKLKNEKACQAEKAVIENTLSPFKKAMLNVYWYEYVQKS